LGLGVDDVAEIPLALLNERVSEIAGLLAAEVVLLDGVDDE